jgi:hypothetical protein
MFIEIGRFLINLDLVTHVEKYGDPTTSVAVFFAGSSERAFTLDGGHADELMRALKNRIKK